MCKCAPMKDISWVRKEYHRSPWWFTQIHFTNIFHNLILCLCLLSPRCGSTAESSYWTQQHWFRCANWVYEVWPFDAFLPSLHPCHCFRILVLIRVWKVKDGALAIYCVVQYLFIYYYYFLRKWHIMLSMKLAQIPSGNKLLNEGWWECC